MSSSTASTQSLNRRAYECVDVGFEIHGAYWHETIKQVPTDTTIATLNANYVVKQSPLTQLYFDAGKDKTRHLYYRGLKWDGETTLEEMLAPGQTKITFNFVWEEKEELLDVQFLIHDSDWTQTIHDVSKDTTVGALNLNFGLLSGSLVPDFRNQEGDQVWYQGYRLNRAIYYQGHKVDPDTRVGDLVQCDQTNVAVHFVWLDDEEQKMLPCDEENIDEFFQEQDEREFEEAGEEFVHDLDLYYEDQLYTAQDHAQRRPSTMTYALAAQKAAIKKHHKTAAEQSVLFTFKGEVKLPPMPQTPEQTPAFSMCIPRVFPNIGDRRVRAIFYNLGYPEIEEIDFVKCEGRNKRTGHPERYNRVFIHFKAMEISSQSTTVHTSISKILNGEQIKIMYDYPWYWLVSISTSTRPAKRPTPPQIMLNEPQTSLSEYELWLSRETEEAYGHYYYE